jgi:hypothetical protein
VVDKIKKNTDKRNTFIRIKEHEREKEEMYFDLPLKFVEDRKCSYY